MYVRAMRGVFVVVWVCGCVVERERCVLVRDVTPMCVDVCRVWVCGLCGVLAVYGGAVVDLGTADVVVMAEGMGRLGVGTIRPAGGGGMGSDGCKK